MPLITVDSRGTVLEYLDTSLLPDHDGVHDEQQTLVVVHGYSWGAPVFQKCFPVASRRRIRLVALNRRGFGSSTPYREDEIGSIRSKACTAEEHRSFMEARAQELAVFLSKLAASNITLMGWSFGNAFCLKLVEMIQDGSLGSLGAEISGILKGCIIFDAPFVALHIPPAPGGANFERKITDSHPPASKHYAFNEFMSSYFQYPPLSTVSDPAELVLMHPKGNMGRTPSVNVMFDQGLYGTIELTDDERDGKTRQNRSAGYTPGASADDNTIVRGLLLGVFSETSKRVLFPKNPQIGSPNRVKIRVLWCRNSCWITVYAVWGLLKEQARKGGNFKTMCLDNANHFVHWDDPERFIEACHELIKGFDSEATIKSSL